MHATDGAPLNMIDAEANGFDTRNEYAQARRRELEAALDLCGIPTERLFEAGFIDQEAACNLVPLTARFFDAIEKIKPGTVFCHAYEGGHPDHDATAFAAHAAVHMVKRSTGDAPVLIEYAIYRAASDGTMAVFQPIPGGVSPWVLLPIQPEQRELKARMVDCFRTQAKILSVFPLKAEVLRIAPECDFTAPPHPGKLYYENFGWGMDAKTWSELASKALSILNIQGPV